MGLDVSIWAAFFAGLLSFLSPCVLPLVPPYLCFIAGTSLEELTGEAEADSAVQRRALAASVLFVLGFSTVFIALGASASVIGQWLREATTWEITIGSMNFPVLTSVAGVIIIIMGLHFLGAFRIGFLSREVRYQQEAKPVGWFGAYAIGLAFALGWTPCIGPVLAAILTVAGSADSVTTGAGLLAIYSAGLGVPFLLAAVAMPQFLVFMKKFRRHLGLVEKAMGGMLVVTGVMFLTGTFTTLSYWMIETFPGLATLG
ncbi:MAG: cytochrome c biogenesis protein CcdA [Anderseniella sp.]|nr:cytochrome c biogenesis protein CcdA [Anderseniella sp.]